MSEQEERFRAATQFERELTHRQREVLGLIAAGRTNAEIADHLDVSLAGAKWHISEIYSKLGLASREEAAAYWHWRRGLGVRSAAFVRALVPGAIPLKLAGGALAAIGVVGVVLAVLLFGRENDKGLLEETQNADWTGSRAYIIAFEEHQIDVPVRYTEAIYQDETHSRWTQTRVMQSGDAIIAHQFIANGTERFTRQESPDTWRIEPLGDPRPQTPSQKQFTLLSGLTGARLGESRAEVMTDLRDRDPGTEMRITGRDKVLGRDVFVVESGPLALEATASRSAPHGTFMAWVDDETFVVLRWETVIDGRVVVWSEATRFEPGAAIPADAFDFPQMP